MKRSVLAVAAFGLLFVISAYAQTASSPVPMYDDQGRALDPTGKPMFGPRETGKCEDGSNKITGCKDFCRVKGLCEDTEDCVNDNCGMCSFKCVPKKGTPAAAPGAFFSNVINQGVQSAITKRLDPTVCPANAPFKNGCPSQTTACKNTQCLGTTVCVARACGKCTVQCVERSTLSTTWLANNGFRAPPSTTTLTPRPPTTPAVASPRPASPAVASPRPAVASPRPAVASPRPATPAVASPRPASPAPASQTCSNGKRRVTFCINPCWFSVCGRGKACNIDMCSCTHTCPVTAKLF